MNEKEQIQGFGFALFLFEVRIILNNFQLAF